jgi:hypothetical protein
MRIFAIAIASILLGACATPPPPAPQIALPAVGQFSTAHTGEQLPSGWQLWTLSNFKKPTEYRVVVDDGRTVIKASARASASGLIFPLHLDLHSYPYLQWRWKVPALIENADNTRRSTEDSPVRMVVAFAGDSARLPFDERIFAQQFKLFTGREMPYATLMYIWENRLPENSIITNAHTSRIKMVVTESGSKRLDQWYAETRNVYEDYKRAFGEEPPPVSWVAIMSDTDNTGESIDAYYGDINFMPAPIWADAGE